MYKKLIVIPECENIYLLCRQLRVEAFATIDSSSVYVFSIRYIYGAFLALVIGSFFWIYTPEENPYAQLETATPLNTHLEVEAVTIQIIDIYPSYVIRRLPFGVPVEPGIHYSIDNTTDHLLLFSSRATLEIFATGYWREAPVRSNLFFGFADSGIQIPFEYREYSKSIAQYFPLSPGSYRIRKTIRSIHDGSPPPSAFPDQAMLTRRPSLNVYHDLVAEFYIDDMLQ